MRFGLNAILALTFVSALAPKLYAQQTPSLTDQYSQLVLSTHLDRKGAPPFHLKLATQLYTLDGRPSQTGTIEEWWMSPDEYRIEINSGSVHEVHATGEPDQSPTPTRDSYLLDQLYEATVDPLQESFPGKDVTETKLKFGKTELACFRQLPPGLIPGAQVPIACTEPGTNNLRVRIRDLQVTVRNSVGTFAATDMGLSTTIFYFGREAINGTITTLERLSPATPGATALKPDPPKISAATTTTRIAGNVLSGKLISKVQPAYPEDARMRQVGGIVLLHAIITKQGTIGSLFVIASPELLLSDAAQNAVSQWRYQPYLLNGQPTVVDTTIQVHFNLNGSW